MVTIWAKIEPDWSQRSLCYSAGKGASRMLASPVASTSLCAAAPCGGPVKVAVRGFLWSLVFFLSILWVLLLSDRKYFSSSIPGCAACCLARSFLLLPGLIYILQCKNELRVVPGWLVRNLPPGLYLASCRWQCILKLAVSHLFVVCALFCT